MALPKNSPYRWLAEKAGPKMIVEALKLYGTIEAPGDKFNNPTIIKWANEVGGKVSDVFKADSIPWCGLFMAVVAKRAGKEVPRDPLWALNWGTFGRATDCPMLGDVLVFTRNGGGHVGLYVGEDNSAYHVLGGNQADAVNIKRFERSRLYTARRPIYQNQPVEVQKIMLPANGDLSKNEQ